MSASVIPTLRYDDPNKAVEFLRDSFGFQEKSVFKSKDGIIEHAELTHGNGMIMIGSTGYESEFSKYMVHPRDVELKQTITVYIIIKDIEAHYRKAQASGIEILLPLTEKSYGGKDYSCRDPEGYVWSFGTYDPWA